MPWPRRTSSRGAAGAPGLLALAILWAGGCRTSAPSARPSPPVVPSSFPLGFPDPVNTHTGLPFEGWGGAGPADRIPVVFLHGDMRTSEDWREPAALLLESGWKAADLWAFTYGYGGGRPDSDEENVENVDRFVRAVTTYVHARRVNLVAHSLGVTVGREWIRRRGTGPLVEHFVAIAGANHGTSLCLDLSCNPLCTPCLCCSTSEPACPTDCLSCLFWGSVGCCEIMPGSPWLQSLNAYGEAPPPTRWMTIYDGTGLYDAAFRCGLADSPALQGAENHPINVEEHLALDHDALRTDPASVALIALFLSR